MLEARIKRERDEKKEEAGRRSVEEESGYEERRGEDKDRERMGGGVYMEKEKGEGKYTAGGGW